mmetsp:Transcript_26659/g.61506  ORF Transcript_26659/g.61506 Transcript_26659/m.61506 type:complete len:208 (-) Transcript_26659:205-828(-)
MHRERGKVTKARCALQLRLRRRCEAGIPPLQLAARGRHNALVPRSVSLHLVEIEMILFTHDDASDLVFERKAKVGNRTRRGECARRSVTMCIVGSDPSRLRSGRREHLRCACIVQDDPEDDPRAATHVGLLSSAPCPRPRNVAEGGCTCAISIHPALQDDEEPLALAAPVKLITRPTVARRAVQQAELVDWAQHSHRLLDHELPVRL